MEPAANPSAEVDSDVDAAASGATAEACARPDPRSEDERRTDALFRLLSNKNFTEMVQAIVGAAAGAFDEYGKRAAAERASEDERTKRAEEAQSLRNETFRRMALVGYLLLAGGALYTVIHLAHEKLLSESAVVPLLAGVIGSLFVKPGNRD